eukprot:gnl/Dysnectes_brevis/4271_a5661_598.p1 GENE.gnl/Dysnectes_brevis/4271_a5661_598~~gnl/Dysnectes_brevis/4271_a5661_598.p1  ORF type:complete len:1180 (-),score=361.11 gnl/Dysnectes_brevis/4271_a5661_598:61-3600(-)
MVRAYLLVFLIGSCICSSSLLSISEKLYSSFRDLIPNPPEEIFGTSSFSDETISSKLFTLTDSVSFTGSASTTLYPTDCTTPFDRVQMGPMHPTEGECLSRYTTEGISFRHRLSLESDIHSHPSYLMTSFALPTGFEASKLTLWFASTRLMGPEPAYDGGYDVDLIADTDSWDSDLSDGIYLLWARPGDMDWTVTGPHGPGEGDIVFSQEEAFIYDVPSALQSSSELVVTVLMYSQFAGGCNSKLQCFDPILLDSPLTLTTASLMGRVPFVASFVPNTEHPRLHGSDVTLVETFSQWHQVPEAGSGLPCQEDWLECPDFEALGITEISQCQATALFSPRELIDTAVFGQSPVFDDSPAPSINTHPLLINYRSNEWAVLLNTDDWNINDAMTLLHSIRIRNACLSSHLVTGCGFIGSDTESDLQSAILDIEAVEQYRYRAGEWSWSTDGGASYPFGIEAADFLRYWATFYDVAEGLNVTLSLDQWVYEDIHTTARDLLTTASTDTLLGQFLPLTEGSWWVPPMAEAVITWAVYDWWNDDLSAQRETSFEAVQSAREWVGYHSQIWDDRGLYRPGVNLAVRSARSLVGTVLLLHRGFGDTLPSAPYAALASLSGALHDQRPVLSHGSFPSHGHSLWSLQAGLLSDIYGSGSYSAVPSVSLEDMGDLFWLATIDQDDSTAFDPFQLLTAAGRSWQETLCMYLLVEGDEVLAEEEITNEYTASLAVTAPGYSAAYSAGDGGRGVIRHLLLESQLSSLPVSPDYDNSSQPRPAATSNTFRYARDAYSTLSLDYGGCMINRHGWDAGAITWEAGGSWILPPPSPVEDVSDWDSYKLTDVDVSVDYAMTAPYASSALLAITPNDDGGDDEAELLEDPETWPLESASGDVYTYSSFQLSQGIDESAGLQSLDLTPRLTTLSAASRTVIPIPGTPAHLVLDELDPGQDGLGVALFHTWADMEDGERDFFECAGTPFAYSMYNTTHPLAFVLPYCGGDDYDVEAAVAGYIYSWRWTPGEGDPETAWTSEVYEPLDELTSQHWRTANRTTLQASMGTAGGSGRFLITVMAPIGVSVLAEYLSGESTPIGVISQLIDKDKTTEDLMAFSQVDVSTTTEDDLHSLTLTIPSQLTASEETEYFTLMLHENDGAFTLVSAEATPAEDMITSGARGPTTVIGLWCLAVLLLGILL